jgi:hypothetical protein
MKPDVKFLTAALLLLSSWAAAEEDTRIPAPFFLIDATDQLCLSGETFKRGSIDTLFYAVGPPGKLDMLGLAQLTRDDFVVCSTSHVSSHYVLSN